MSKFGEDSFDDILAKIEEPTTTTQPKQARFSIESDDVDKILANISMPTASTSAKPAEKVTNAPISAGKTNCILVNPKQRGISI